MESLRDKTCQPKAANANRKLLTLSFPRVPGDDGVVFVGNGHHSAVVAHACAHPPGLTTSLRSPALGAHTTGTGPNHLRTSAVSTGNIHIHVTQRLAHSLRMRMGVAIARRDR